MILLDTHIWVWWMNDDNRFSDRHRQIIRDNESTGVAVSVISCWEVATLVGKGRLQLRLEPLAWIEAALTHPSVRLAILTPRIAVDSTFLPDWDHRDPADRIIVATARAQGCAVLTEDARILAYPHVQTL